MKGPTRRYAERPWAEVSIEIDADPVSVWPLISDIELPARFSSEFQGAEWLSSEGPGLGAGFVGHNRRGDVEWDTTSTIYVYDPPRSFGWLVGDPDDATARWRFDSTPGEQGGLTLSMWAEMGPGPSGVLSYILRHPDREADVIERRLDEWLDNMQATLEGIRALAERES